MGETQNSAQFIGGVSLYLSLIICSLYTESVIQPFTEATRMISSSTYPTIPLVIPLYCSLENHLKMAMSDLKLSATIHGAVAMGHAKLLRYKTKAMVNQY